MRDFIHTYDERTIHHKLCLFVYDISIIVCRLCNYVVLCMFICSISVYSLSTVCCYVFLWHLFSHNKLSPQFCIIYVCEDSTNNFSISLTGIQHTCYTIKNCTPYNVTHVGDYNICYIYIIMMTNVLAPSITWFLQVRPGQDALVTHGMVGMVGVVSEVN